MMNSVKIMPSVKTPPMEWLYTGNEIFPAMLAAISAAQESVQLETYIYRDDKIGRQFLEAMLAAAQRGVRVRVLVDAAGSWFLPGIFLIRWSPPVPRCAVSIRFISGDSACVTTARC